MLCCLVSWFLLSLTPSYHTQRALLVLLVNFTIADVTLNLMLHNMARRKFTPVQPALLYLIIPIFAILVCGVDGQAESLLIKALTAMSFITFYCRMAVICKQYIDFAKRTFWTRTVPAVAEKKVQ